MKKHTKTILYLGAAGVSATAALLYLVAPGRSTAAQRAPFVGQNLAHRGLFDPAHGVPENSLAAFRAAATAGYGVELDVRLTLDGQVVISHDNNVERMTGYPKLVDQCTLEELQKLRLGGTDERIPLFRTALELLTAAGVPVVVEVKSVAKRDELCRKTLAIMDACGGHVCVESFDPFTVRWFRRHAPELLRGQLTSQCRDLGNTPGKSFLVSRVLSNFLCRPQFIAHHVGRKSLCVRLCEAMGAMKVRWTAHDRSWEKGSDAVIFEHFLPPLRYR